MQDFTLISRVPVPVRWAASLFAVLAIALTLFLAYFNWNLLRGPLARELTARSGRPVRIEGDLNVRPWSWTPTVIIRGLKVGEPAWMKGAPDVADVDSLTVSFKLMSLLAGHLDFPLVDVERPQLWLFKDASGRANWRSSANGAPTKLPPIQHFVINAGHVRWVDQQRKLVVVGMVQSHENAARPGAGDFELNGDGSINAAPFTLRLTGGALLNVKREQPYHFDGTLRAGDTYVTAHGVLSKPFDFGLVDTALTVSGRDFANLYQLTGLALPNTPPYRLSGRLAREGKVYSFTGVSGRVGDSDLEGTFRVDDTTGRPNMRANLRSRRLDAKDLGSLVGAPAKTAQTTPAQREDAARRAAEHRILPDAVLDVERIRRMDAVLDYRADSVLATPHLPLRQMKLHLTLDHGVLTLDPVEFAFPRGQLAGRVRLDATEATPRTDLDLHVTNIHVEDFFKSGANPPLEGALEARAKLHGTGASVARTAATASGGLTLVEPKGAMRKAFAELTGIDVLNGVGLFLAGDHSDTQVRCAVADFQAQNGVFQVRNLVMDTDPVLITGKGEMDMRDEHLDLTLQGHPKKFRLLRIKAPISVGGQLSSPKFGVKADAVPLQLTGAAALGAALGPIAAILPFVDPGLAKDANCADLMTQARQQGAPVKPSMTTPTPVKAH